MRMNGRSLKALGVLLLVLSTSTGSVASQRRHKLDGKLQLSRAEYLDRVQAIWMAQMIGQRTACFSSICQPQNQGPPHSHKIGTIAANTSQRGIFISLLFISLPSRHSFEIRVSRDDPSLVFDDVLAKAKGIAVLMVSLCQEFSRHLYGNDVEQELPFSSDRGN
jgi:hypothetical protein